MKKRIILASIAILLTGVFSAFAFESKSANAVVDGEICKNIKVYDSFGEDYFSVNQMAQLYGARLVWHPVTGKVAFLMNNKQLDIYIKSTKYLLDGKKKRLGSPTHSVSKDVLVPAVFFLSSEFSSFSEMLSSWNPDTKILTVEKKVNLLPPRFYCYPDRTEIVIEQLESLSHEWNIKKAGRILLTFPRGRLAAETIGVDDGIVREIDAKCDGRLAAVTIYLTAGAGKPQKKVLSSPPRIVIDIPRTALEEKKLAVDTDTVVIPTTAEIKVSSPDISEPVVELVKPAIEKIVLSPEVPPAAVPAPVISVPVAVKETKSAKKKLIILDAGHGGDDPGAIGRNGTKEKDINLAIVTELKKLFDEGGEYDTMLTRTNDTFIPLVERTTMANEKKSDLFVSVHCNASMDKNTGGFEIYFLSENASDAEAAATAILENSVIRLESKPTRRQTKIQELLWSMMVNEYINESSELCSLITSEVKRRLKIQNRGVRQAGFYVLRGTQMPAVLVECAFLSHLGEEAKLKTKKFQRQIADAVYEGVRGYMARKDNKNIARGTQ